MPAICSRTENFIQLPEIYYEVRKRVEDGHNYTVHPQINKINQTNTYY